MIDLTPEQSCALSAGDIRVRDPETRSTYVLVSEDAFRRMQNLLETGPLTSEERQTIMRGVWDRAGWADPRMDDYDAIANSP